MTPIEHMRRMVTRFEATGQIVELSQAHAWATISIAEHLERTCQPQETPPAADTADPTNNSAKRGRRTSQPAMSTAAAVGSSSQEATSQTASGPSHGTSTTTTTGLATADQLTSDATK